MAGLEAFVDKSSQEHADSASSSTLRAVLVFSFGDTRFMLAAESVLSILASRPVMRIPGAHPGFAGAIQDRGRVIGLLAHPLAASGSQAAGKRVIVCRTRDGLLGLPASAMHEHQELPLETWPDHGSVIDHGGHACTFIDPDTLGRACRGAASAAVATR